MQESSPGGRPSRPDRIGPFRILDVLGEGGMGTVYLGEQRQPVLRRVAIKVVKLGMDSKAILARFEQERQAIALMQHDGIAKVHDCGTTESGQPFFAMEYVIGTMLTQYCDQARLSVAERIELIQQVCSAVQHAHQKGVVHRDLKPSNVLVTEEGGRRQIKIIDFGLAKAMGQKLVEATLFTEAGQVVGTPEYMAPEQADPSNQDIDTRADIYSIGVMLYELLTGHLPFTAQELRHAGMMEMQRVLREVDPPKPSTKLRSTSAGSETAALRKTSELALRRVLQQDLDWLVLKSLEKDRAMRYETASALSLDLQRFLDHEPLQAGPPSAAYRLRKFVRRHRVQVGFAAVLLVSMAMAATGIWIQWRKAQEQELIAEIKAADNQKLAAQMRIVADEEASARKAAEASGQQARTQRDRAESARLISEARRLLGEEGEFQPMLAILLGLEAEKLCSSPEAKLLLNDAVQANRELFQFPIGKSYQYSRVEEYFYYDTEDDIVCMRCADGKFVSRASEFVDRDLLAERDSWMAQRDKDEFVVFRTKDGKDWLFDFKAKTAVRRENPSDEVMTVTRVVAGAGTPADEAVLRAIGATSLSVYGDHMLAVFGEAGDSTYSIYRTSDNSKLRDLGSQDWVQFDGNRKAVWSVRSTSDANDFVEVRSWSVSNPAEDSSWGYPGQRVGAPLSIDSRMVLCLRRRDHSLELYALDSAQRTAKRMLRLPKLFMLGIEVAPSMRYLTSPDRVHNQADVSGYRFDSAGDSAPKACKRLPAGNVLDACRAGDRVLACTASDLISWNVESGDSVRRPLGVLLRRSTGKLLETNGDEVLVALPNGVKRFRVADLEEIAGAGLAGIPESGDFCLLRSGDQWMHLSDSGLTICDSGSGQARTRLSFEDIVDQVAVSRGGANAAAVMEGGFAILRKSDGSKAMFLPVESPAGLSISPDGKTAYVASSGQKMDDALIDLEAGKVLRSIRKYNLEQVVKSEFSNDSKMLAGLTSAKMKLGKEDKGVGSVILCRLDDAGSGESVPIPVAVPLGVEFSGDDRHIVTFDTESASLFTVAPLRRIGTWPFEGITGARFSSDNSSLVLCGSKGIEVWPVDPRESAEASKTRELRWSDRERYSLFSEEEQKLLPIVERAIALHWRDADILQEVIQTPGMSAQEVEVARRLVGWRGGLMPGELVGRGHRLARIPGRERKIYEEALEISELAIRRGGKLAYAWTGALHGVILFRLERYEECLKEFEALMALPSKDDFFKAGDAAIPIALAMLKELARLRDSDAPADKRAYRKKLLDAEKLLDALDPSMAASAAKR